MAILYEDQYLVCDEDALTIHWYYFPIGSKCISYTKIRSFKEENIDFWNGAGRIWGMGLAPYWFPLDPKRPWKNKCIIIDDGEWVKSVITPENNNQVMQILSEKIRSI